MLRVAAPGAVLLDGQWLRASPVATLGKAVRGTAVLWLVGGRVAALLVAMWLAVLAELGLGIVLRQGRPVMSLPVAMS